MEEKLLFKNTSRLGKEEIDVFQNLAVKRTSLVTSLFILFICVGAGIGLYFVHMALGIGFIVAGVLGAIIMPYVVKETVKKQNQEIFNFKDTKYLNSFEFYEDKIVVLNEIAKADSDTYEEKGKDIIKYSDIDHAVVYGIYIFIFINKYQSVILNQKGMTEGVAADLIEYMKSKGIKVDYKKEYARKK